MPVAEFASRPRLRCHAVVDVSRAEAAPWQRLASGDAAYMALFKWRWFNEVRGVVPWSPDESMRFANGAWECESLTLDFNGDRLEVNFEREWTLEQVFALTEGLVAAFEIALDIPELMRALDETRYARAADADALQRLTRATTVCWELRAAPY
jgi:hypothetical protein